jgi:hypothetical protein
MTIANGFADLSGPFHNPFQTVVTTAYTAAAGLEGLQKDPENGNDQGDRPYDDDEQDDPYQCETRIAGPHTTVKLSSLDLFLWIVWSRVSSRPGVSRVKRLCRDLIGKLDDIVRERMHSDNRRSPLTAIRLLVNNEQRPADEPKCADSMVARARRRKCASSYLDRNRNVRTLTG